MTMLREVPSGREQAIETLLDMEPQGSFYRASRVLEESVPQALLHRPSLVTKSALVDEACALSKHEIDNHEKYDSLFGNHESRILSFSGQQRLLKEPITETKKNRILRHHSKIMAAKQRGSSTKKDNTGTASPSPQLINALRRLYEKPGGASGELPALKSLLQSVMDHPTFSSEDIIEPTSRPKTKSASAAASAKGTTTTTTTLPSSYVEETTYTLESLIAYLCKETSSSSPPFSPALEHGLLITVLSVLTEYEIRDEELKGDPKGNPKDYYEQKVQEEQQQRRRHHDATNDPTVAPPLQVGAIMSLLKIDDGDNDDYSTRNASPWSLDNDLLSYLGEAAAVYEERIEIQKSRLLKRLSVGKGKRNDGNMKGDDTAGENSVNDDSDVRSSLFTTPAPALLASPQPVETPQTPATPDAVATEVRDALSDAVIEHIISATTGEEASVNDGDNIDDNHLTQEEPETQQNDNDNVDIDVEDDDDEDEDEDDEDKVNDIVEDNDDENASSCSSSSSSSSSGSDAEPGDEYDEEENDNDEIDDEENSNDDDDDMVLRQALALSMVEQVESYSTEIDSATTNDDTDESAMASTDNPLYPVTPKGRSSRSEELKNDRDTEESPLPSMPTPPRIDPYASLRGPNIQIDDDQMQKDSLSFDPSALHLFGSIPASDVLIQLLLYMNAVIECRKFQDMDKYSKNAKKNRCTRGTAIPGGIGSSLFTPKLTAVKTKIENENDRNDIATSLQLLISLFLLTIDMRSDAIDNLKRAVAQEQKDLHDDNVADDSMLGADSSEEGDDPAIALGLTYIDDENSESKESLEAKGMKRKAAAAAHDAAALSESLRKRANAWKKQVNFFSQCCFLSMKSLRLFLQCVTRNWLRDQRGVSTTILHEVLPTSVISKLSIGLASLSSTGMTNSFHPILAGQEDNVDDPETIFMHSKLYKSSILTWGESVPIIYPSVTAQVEVLRSLLTECSKHEITKQHRSLDNMISLPLLDSEPPFHRLQILSRRLRVSDLLNRFVSGPTSLLPGSDSVSETEKGAKKLELGEPNCARSVIDSIGSASIAYGSLKRDLHVLHLALCHRYHVRVLLWDGLGTFTETELDESTASLIKSPVDTLRVGQDNSNKIEFDATKCSDSMSIISSSDASGSHPTSSSINQRASKVWGTVLSSTPFSPKTGIHRWAIRLDKCERGHVFIGVATAQASMRTYVGGDKYGWGMIGTQALWHDRRKIRGDYGATFRTGSTIVVTLDTDAGTISYSSWKDNSSTSSYSVDQMVQSISSPRRHGQGVGIVDDWGVAFEGLPLDSKLYPAVGLYQRDDKVTLLTVEAIGTTHGGSGSSTILTEGLCYYPSSIPSSENDKQMITLCEKTRAFNEKVQLDGIHYVINSLEQIVDSIRKGTGDILWKSLLPSLACAICLFPRNLPILSKRFGLTVISQLSKSIQALERLSKFGLLEERGLFHNGLQEGKWVIRATGSNGSNSDAEEYIVDLTSSTEKDVLIGFEGNGVGTIGKSKNGLVSILGTVKGSSVHFVEEWTDASDEGFSSIASDDSSSSCVINARLSLDRKKFDGTYHNVQFGTTGHIAGLLCEGNSSVKVSLFRLKESPIALNQQISDSSCGSVALLGLAHSHLASIIGEDLVNDDTQKTERTAPESSPLTQKEWEFHSTELRNSLMLKTFARSSLTSIEDDITKHIQDLRDLYLVSSTFRSDELSQLSEPLMGGLRSEFRSDSFNNSSSSKETAVQVEDMDADMCTKCCGTGSLAALCPTEYRRARHLIICTLLTHCKKITTKASDSDLKKIWTWALKLMEDGVRNSVASGANIPVRKKATECCELFCIISEFLLCLDPSSSTPECIDIDTVGADFSRLYGLVSSTADLKFLREEFCRSSRRSLLRLIPVREILSLLDSPIGSSHVVESLVDGVPRLLGRGYIDINRPQSERNESSSNDELGGYYLSNLPGVANAVRQSLQQNVHELLNVICRLADRGLTERKKDISSKSLVSIDSMTLALVSCLTNVLRRDDIRAFVLNSQLLTLIPALLDIHRPSLMSSNVQQLSEGETMSVVKDLHNISHIEVSRAILRATVSLAHVVFYQTWDIMNADIASGVETSTTCLDILLRELKKLHPLFLDAVKNSVLETQKNKRKLQWELFCIECSNKADTTEKPAIKTKINHQVGRSGVNYVQENGLLTIAQLSSPQKASGTRKSPASQHGSDKFVKTQGIFSHQFFSHWLHILVAATDTKVSRTAIVKGPGWIPALFLAIGINVEVGEEGKILNSKLDGHPNNQLPAIYRCRLLRLLHPILETMAPSKTLAQSLFDLTGSSCSSITLSLDEDEGMVSRETVSLLRRLHSPTQTSWRACINNIVHQNLSLSDSTEQRYGRIGALCFLNGSLDSIKKGSRVLLKPAAAVPLSADRQAASSSKSHSNSSTLVNSSPHHLVGNGTEGIVAGLCRFSASAGVVSSIDTKNGVCEVILLKRSSAFTESLPEKDTLTVRALRSPMSDIVLSQEVSIFIDESMLVENLVPRLLEDSLSILQRARSFPDASKDSTGLSNLRSQMIGVTIALMSLRSSITLLADENIAASFLKHEKARTVLSQALRLAYPDDLSSPETEKVDLMNGARDTCLSSFPVHEVRLLHIQSLFQSLGFEESVLDETPEVIWDTRIQEIRKRIEAEASDSVNSDNDERYNTPPAGADRIPETPPASSAIGGSAEAKSSREESSANRTASQSTAASENSEEEDEESEAAAIAAAHLREAAIAQMAELGLPRSWSELALRRTGGTNIEAAVHFCLERGGEMERLLVDERERERQSSGGSSRRRSARAEASSHLLRQLTEMGFPSRWCAEALTATGNNVDEALTWILTNGERLSAEDEGMDDVEDDADEEEEDDEEEDDDEEEEDDDDDDDEDSQATNDQLLSSSLDEEKVAASKKNQNEFDSSEKEGWSGSIVPLRFISGRSIIDQKTLTISGLPSGGFSSVGSKGVMLTTGKWYYEAILETAGCLQIGWADGSFAGHCHSDRGDGCGDGPSSWAFDGWRRYRWHSMATEWGCRWAEGDVIGCLVDMDENIVSFTLNGKAEEIGMGVAFSGQGFRPCGGVYACVSFNRREKLRLILGGPESVAFKYPPPPGYRGVGEAVLECVKERDELISKESSLGIEPEGSDRKRFLCDFSDGEHGHELMAWAHRYYGSDASVHLGSGRTKQSNTNSKISSSSSSLESTIAYCLSRRIGAELAKSDYELFSGKTDDENKSTQIQILQEMKKGIRTAGSLMCKQAFTEAMVLSSLITRKLLLNIVVATGEKFDPETVLASDENAQESALRFWNMIEASTSLRTAGWVGEAGAMAIAAEALGLGISSTESLHSRLSTLERSGFVSIADLDEGVLLPAGGLVQMLNTVIDWNAEGTTIPSTGSTLAASAEPAIGSGGGGGVLIFLLKGLQAAVIKSEEFRRVVIACIRRSVRQLAVVEYENDDSTSPDEENDKDDDNDSINKSSNTAKEKKTKSEKDGGLHPDARLVSFLTGLLLSKPVAKNIDNFHEVHIELFEAWSVGLLSASLPWRMICALSTAGILNQYPSALSVVVKSSPTLSRYYARLRSTVCRRVWAERAAVPISSRYCQAMIELLCSVTRAVNNADDLPSSFMSTWKKIAVDAATPLPFPKIETKEQCNWELDDGWISSDRGWEIWTGTTERFAVDWRTPSRSAVRTLMEGGDGPPMLREGCTVIRGLDWEVSKYGNDDGKDIYEIEKAKREEDKMKSKASPETVEQTEVDDQKDEQNTEETNNPIEDSGSGEESTKPTSVVSGEDESENKTSKKKKYPSPKLPIGTVVSIEEFNGIPGMARRVRWHLTGAEGVYRYGGDGGCYDISHVEANDRETRVRKRHPLPESEEQCAARHGFGMAKCQSVLLRLRRSEKIEKMHDGEVVTHREGILELPEFGSGIYVTCTFKPDGSFVLHEKHLLYGSKDSGWQARFGKASYVPGTSVTLNPTKGFKEGLSQADIDSISPNQSLFEEFIGVSTYCVENLRNREDGGQVQVTSELRFTRGRRTSTAPDKPLIEAPMPPSMRFDQDFHASSLSLSCDGRTLSCVSSDGRGTAFGNMGFSKGVHYWEIKLEQADIGSVFVGVAEKPNENGSGSSHAYDSPPRLNRWHGWGFVNFRATYTTGAERIYGAHCHAGDTIGVLLDCDSGRIGFFFDGLKYGEHILNDLGCAFENLSPFGFNVSGCGSGGAGQGAPSGTEGSRSGRYPSQGSVRPRTLWPVVGLRNHGDRVTFSSKWSSSYGVDSASTIRNIIATDEIIQSISNSNANEGTGDAVLKSSKLVDLPKWFISEGFAEYKSWNSNLWRRTSTRGSGPFPLTSFGLDVDLDSSFLACASASALLGLKRALLSGDRVRLKRSAGRILELAEEAIVLGSYQGRLYYQIVSQKSEGGSLTEGGGRPWMWDESEVVDGIEPINEHKGKDIVLPLMDRFRCTSSGGLKVVYEGGAVVRSDLEIFEGSLNLGSIPIDTVIPKVDVLERRVNACGVVRYRVRFEDLEGWISSKIRGGEEDPIVVPSHLPKEKEETETEEEDEQSYLTPGECALEWLKNFTLDTKIDEDDVSNCNGGIESIDSFESLAAEGVIDGYSELLSDSFLARTVGTICDFSEGGNPLDAPFDQVASALKYAIASCEGTTIICDTSTTSSLQANQAAASAFESLGVNKLPPLSAIMARIALLRAFNRRARIALPWLSVRPCQEGSAILGGIYGHGASIDRAGRNSNKDLLSQWVQVPSISKSIRSIRGLLFTSVKQDLLRSITEATTTPTPLSHDEYELPREIRTVRINRLRARRVMSGDDVGAKRKYSVFAQLQEETKAWGGAGFRRGFVAKGHGGQKRAFKMKLIGEGVNDYSGPYREAFTDALGEILQVVGGGNGSLGVLDPTPNNISGIGENRDLYMFSLNGSNLSSISDVNKSLTSTERSIRSTFSTLITAGDESSREVEEALVFLGRLTGTAFRHGIPLDLPLPMNSVWKAMVEEESNNEGLQELDSLAHQQHAKDDEKSTMLLMWQQRMLNSFIDGLSSVLPVEIFSILTGEELRDFFCGNPEIDVDMLRRVVEYEGYDESDAVIEYFWEVLRELTNEERKRFLQFVWARNRLPMKESDFDAPFKIQKDNGSDGEQALPSASTCFFSLTLPAYKSKKHLKEKLLFAINNVTTMETDFQTNSAEIAEGYRAF